MLALSLDVFSKLWDWSCFLDLPKQLTDFSGSTENQNGAADIRWCVARILSIIFRLEDTSAALGIGADEGFKCFLRSVTLDFLVIIASVSIGTADFQNLL